MAKKSLYTPNSRITACLRQLWMRSRERAKALKDTKYCCSECGAKQSKAKGKEVKIQVHHWPAINWKGLRELIRERLLDVPQVPLCVPCHLRFHEIEDEKIEIMKKHVKIYFEHHGYGEQDIILCEQCGITANAIHHKKFKSLGGTDEIDNLIALCDDCHAKAHGLV